MLGVMEISWKYMLEIYMPKCDLEPIYRFENDYDFSLEG